MLFRMTLVSSTGCYRIQGDRLTLSRAGRQEITLPFHLSRERLVLTRSGCRPLTYDLAADGPWYDREHPASLKLPGM
jgi:hypothetical protein